MEKYFYRSQKLYKYIAYWAGSIQDVLKKKHTFKSDVVQL